MIHVHGNFCGKSSWVSTRMLPFTPLGDNDLSSSSSIEILAIWIWAYTGYLSILWCVYLRLSVCLSVSLRLREHNVNGSRSAERFSFVCSISSHFVPSRPILCLSVQPIKWHEFVLPVNKMETISTLVRTSLPNYLQGLPIPNSIGGFAQLSGNLWYASFELSLKWNIPANFNSFCKFAICYSFDLTIL